MGSTMLNGVRVVELAGLGPLPFAGMLLADLGAEVISVRRPGAAPTALTRGRPSLELDLKSSAGRADLHRLLARADVVMEGYRPGVLERLGLGPDEVQQAHPRVVYARMTGWGQTGPRSATAGHDLSYIAVTGALHVAQRRTPSAALPTPPANLLGDFGGGGMYLATSVLAALLRRERDGVAEVLDVAVLDGTVYLTSMLHEYRSQGRWSDEPASNRLDTGAPYYDVYPCADGRFVAVAALEDPFFVDLLDLLGIASPLPFDRTDPTNWAHLRGMIGDVVLTRTRDEWSELALRRDACLAPVLDLAEAAHDPQVAARELLQPRADAGGFRPSLPWGTAPEPKSDPQTVDEVLLSWGAGHA
ncbi:CaiB/BaiF CoA-transferase family protein [Pseudonocardia sp. McavD-2-B]|uniref:CaiB/BaiF CoA transferase family protein n=1 Tax=Pseudonocardia sp. McavD-2-B TaxID=2954499 RepID=UPI002097B688|nr:CaiB/BaiF CoA-transferase family protein [Pseudonocardia sp. McavD-2-B]MCO7191502.1 CoA transferase [Pseudonocardia sp. McavD-2-B]